VFAAEPSEPETGREPEGAGPVTAAELPAEPEAAAEPEVAAPVTAAAEPPAEPEAAPEPEVAGPVTAAGEPSEPEAAPEPEVAGPVTAAELPAEPEGAPEPEVAVGEPHGEPPAEPRVRSGEERRAPTSVLRNVVEWVTILGGALLVALVVTRFLIQAFFIPSLSMFPALDEGDRVLVNKLSYRLHEVNRGDLVVFERPSDDGGPGQVKDLIKRVVGLEGEQIEARGGRVLIDGRPLSEPYLAPGVETTDFEPVDVPAGHVFVMGDNRGDSRDSRFFGPLPEELVIGRAFVKVWPLDDLELL
jgi:signal peptidase I